MRKVLIYSVVFFVGVAIAGCGGRKTSAPVEVVEGLEVVEGIAGDTGVNVTGLGGDEGAGGQSLEQTDSSGDAPLGQRVIYFEYDSSILTAEGEAVVRAHARHLNEASNDQVILEGHADERGTREYNLALAEDRAKAVANLLQALGVGSGRIQTVSYGEERPIALGHDESAWSMNRRVEILYQ